MITITLMPPWLALMLVPLPPVGIVAATLILAYVMFEVGFFFHYHWHLVPRANQIFSGPPAPYRDYLDVKDREKLLVRILDRLADRLPATSTANDKRSNTSDGDVYYKFIESWFQKKSEDAPYQLFSEQFDMATLDVGLCPPPPPILRMAWSSYGGTDSSDVDAGDDTKLKPNKDSSDSLLVSEDSELSENFPSNATKNACNGVTGNKARSNVVKEPSNGRLQKDNMDEFLSWAFFGVPLSAVQSNPTMRQALSNFYDILQTRAGLTFEPGHNPDYKTRSFTFENLKSLYRPYGVYAGVALMRLAANCVLYLLGFRQYTCKRGLRYWHRSAKQQNQSPFMFFHGIAPGGHAPYLPMLFMGVLRGPLSHRQRDVFLFENKPISYALCFDALSEEDTVHGVLEAIRQHLGTTATANNLTLCGHSFGSCQLSWMVKCPEMKNMIRSLILLDPVSILLSEPDVVVNFLYARQDLQDSYDGNPNSWVGKLIRFINEAKIRLVASSEMFIEHYLRRNFAWYNSELWLQDIPPGVKAVCCLAECDEIVNTPKIARELSLHNSKVSRGVGMGAVVDKVIWKDVGHAHCVVNPQRWCDIHHAMTKIESQIAEDDSLQKSR